MSVQIILKNSKVEDKRPTAAQLTNGEPSLNYHEAGAFLCCKDTNGNIQQIGGIKISDDAPGTPVKGTLWFQPSTSRLYVHNGTTWLTAAAGGGGGGGGGGAVDQVIAGDGIDVTPVSGQGVITIDADIDENRGLEFVSGKIAVKLGTGLEFDSTTGALNVTVDGLTYKGTVDLTTAGDVPASPDVGDAYANTGNGAFDAEWVTATGEPAGTDADPGDLVVWNGTVWTFIPTGGSGGGGTANLTYTPTIGDTPAVGGTIESESGTDAEIPLAGFRQAGVLSGAAQAGLMSPTDKDKLDNIQNFGVVTIDESPPTRPRGSLWWCNDDAANGGGGRLYISYAVDDTDTLQWVPATPDAYSIGGGGTTIQYLNDLLDVNAASPSDDDFLTWDNSSSRWVNTGTIDCGTF